MFKINMSGKDYRVSLLSKRYQTAKEMILEKLKSIGRF